MSTTAKGFTQDLPPKEGYSRIQTERIPLRTVLGGRKVLGISLFCTVIGHYVYYTQWKRIKRESVEMRSAQFAILPFLIAERDRGLLKQVKRNYADEKELMKDYPGWKVGTYFGEPIYKTIPEDAFVEPDSFEYFAHTEPDEMDWKSVLRQIY
ncbi:PREDICTED: NADH dehydrogenase [ubiquinone] 1 alpha subcomplex subunit 13 [Polistes dominula]|uniref:NADH dehydrogenase [ubiquinone] 1 alpha subcomplex subunit 13 n=1 Tax=Polistes dominula TaxID=743375 RepID=A0ABM1HVP7_POLDO|nr:PREDICTED: NADH dehydrogenase [ubiquinone] 1 alpha subcomplex subunit 13 [Polistes dominula]